jgi:hypothetical protein
MQNPTGFRARRSSTPKIETETCSNILAQRSYRSASKLRPNFIQL